MSVILQDYLPIVVFIAIAVVIVSGLMVAPFLVAYKNPDAESRVDFLLRRARKSRGRNEN